MSYDFQSIVRGFTTWKFSLFFFFPASGGRQWGQWRWWWDAAWAAWRIWGWESLEDVIFQGSGFGRIKLDAKIDGNFEGFPVFSCIVWVGNVMTPAFFSIFWKKILWCPPPSEKDGWHDPNNPISVKRCWFCSSVSCSSLLSSCLKQFVPVWDDEVQMGDVVMAHSYVMSDLRKQAYDHISHCLWSWLCELRKKTSDTLHWILVV